MQKRFADFILRSYRKRRGINAFMTALLLAAALAAVLPLFSVFGYVVMKGWPGLNGSLFTELPKPVGEAGGGIANAFLGTLTLVALASLVGIPWGVAVGVFLSEYRTKSRICEYVRIAADLLASVPSIIIGLFVYACIVLPMKHFSAFAGSLALGLLMVPTVARTTEELLNLVPQSVREAGLALGLPRWKVILWVVLRGSRAPILTGVMLSVARISGETAPLLFTAFNNRFWQQGLNQPISSVPVQIYTYAISPFDEWHRQAWAGALILVVLVFAINLLTRAVLSGGSRRVERA